MGHPQAAQVRRFSPEAIFKMGSNFIVTSMQISRGRSRIKHKNTTVNNHLNHNSKLICSYFIFHIILYILHSQSEFFVLSESVPSLLLSSRWRCGLTVELNTAATQPTAESSRCENQMFIPFK